MTINKSRIDIVFSNGERTTIPCFTILSPLIVNKMEQQQGPDIKSISVASISTDEYDRLLRLQDYPLVTDEEIFHQHFWNAT
jgi:hypothetical protein